MAKVRDAAVSKSNFLKVYREGVEAGLSAQQIGEKFGKTGDNAANFVTVKASAYRKAARSNAEAFIKSQKLNADSEAAQKIRALAESKVLMLGKGQKSKGDNELDGEFAALLADLSSQNETETE